MQNILKRFCLKERMVFEDGFLTVTQPLHATVGIEARQGN